jgi:hypothetical protein
MRLVFQAMNIDVEFYDKYYPKGSYSETHLDKFLSDHPEARGRAGEKSGGREARAAGGAKKNIKA